MKIYLLDTNIISEPTRLNPNENLLQKLAENSNLMIEKW